MATGSQGVGRDNESGQQGVGGDSESCQLAYFTTQLSCGPKDDKDLDFPNPKRCLGKNSLSHRTFDESEKETESPRNEGYGWENDLSCSRECHVCEKAERCIG